MTVIPNDIDTELTGISNSKSAIKQAIIDQGVEVSEEDALSTYAAKIRQINTGGSSRNIGEIVESVVPLTDAGLHLLDGAVIDGNGAYSDFVDYIAGIYNSSPKITNAILRGSLVDTEGVISNFNTTTSYILIPNLPTGSSSIEFVQKITTSSFTSVQNMLAYGGNIAKSIAYNILSSGKLNLYVSSNGSDWDIISGAQSTLTLNENSTYYIKIYYNNSTYKIDVSTTGDFTGEEINYITENGGQYYNSCNFCDMGLFMDSTPINPFLGSIDLNECYININNTMTWQGRMPIGFTYESNWQTFVTTYGVCGKFVYDNVNNTVRLPKITGILEGTTDVTTLGDLIEAGLPNITGGFSSAAAIYPEYVSGAFVSRTDVTGQGEPAGSITGNVGFNASKSNPIYGNSDTVQPQTIKALYYIVIATSTKTEIEVDIDEIATDLNGKVDVDFANCTDAAKVRMAHNAFPSSRYVNLTLGADGSAYQAPADGWITFRSDFRGNDDMRYLYLYGKLYAGDETVGNNLDDRETDLLATLPVSKGDTFYVYHNLPAKVSGEIRIFRFYYANGSENEVQQI